MHLVHSYDHVAIDPKVTECDFSNVPLDDSTLDAAVFSMSLMGNNLEDYIEEAYRTLRLGGQLLIWNTGDEEANSSLYGLIQERGFNVVDAEEVYKFYRMLAIKQAR